MLKRFRSLRASEAMRDLVRETALDARDLVLPFFVIDGKKKKEPIGVMPGISRFSPDTLLKEVEHYVHLGGRAGILFGVAEKKIDPALLKNGAGSFDLIPRAVKAVKKHFPDFLVITDVCLCAYADHGHCGIVRAGKIDNDATLPLLAGMALAHAQAGADIVAPSDMMDFRARAIRDLLNKHGLTDTGILSYAVKYASAYYGPFRQAANSSPGFGDRKTYQMDPANSREALKEALQDVSEGADMVMVKPALAYLDIVAKLRNALTVPVAAYNVSGEYSMVKAAVARGLVNEREIVLENLLGFKRAGADFIVTYHATDVLKWLK